MCSVNPTGIKLTQRFPFKIKEPGSHFVVAKDTYCLDLLGFVDGVPMLTVGKPLVTPTLKPINESATSLQGKKVIIKTNSMSGEKSLIFKQKTGENVEIPARHCSFVKTSDTTITDPIWSSEVPPPLEPIVDIRHKPTILKRKGRLRYQIITKNKTHNFNLVKDKTTTVVGDLNNMEQTNTVEEQKCTTEEQKSSTEHQKSDYPNDSINASNLKHDEMVQKPDDSVRVFRRNVPQFLSEDGVKSPPPDCPKSVKTYERPKPNEEVRNKMAMLANEANKNSRNLPQYKVVNKKRPFIPVKDGSDALNGQLSKPEINKDLNGVKSNTYIVMIANQQIKSPNLHVNPPTPVINHPKVSASHSTSQHQHLTNFILNHQLARKPKAVGHTYPPVVDTPVKQILKQKINKTPKKADCSMQTDAHETRTIETNTDDSLLQDLINKRIEETAVPIPNPVTLSYEKTDPPPQSDIPERISTSPFSLISDADLILDLCNFYEDPNIKAMGSHFSDQLLSGKCMNNLNKSERTELLDISYSTGKNVPQRGRLEPWRLQFFLDLKHCNQFDNYGNIPLHVAIMENNLNRVKRQLFALRVRNFSVDALNHNSLTALQLGLLHDVSVPILQTLISHNANPAVLDAEGNTLLHLAVLHSSDAVVQMLLGTCSTLAVDASNFEGDTALILCVLHKKYVKADKILQAGANPNIGDKKSGRTPLFHAVEANDVEMVKILLNYKAQTKVRNYFGTSPHDAMFELDSVDKTIRKLVLNKDYPNYRSKPEPKEKKKRKEPEEGPPPNTKNAKLKTERLLVKIGGRKL